MSGRIFEDFVPISDTHALITVGRSLSSLDRIEEVGYTVGVEDRVVVQPGGRLVAREHRGHLRLGGLFNGQLVYSDQDKGIVGAIAESKTAHQPFVFQGELYYTDYPSGQRPRAKIYKNGEVFLGWFDDYEQVTNPCWASDGCLYFEARTTTHPEQVHAWEIWRRTPDGEVQLLFHGANPAAWGDYLFWGVWNGKAFTYRRKHVFDLVPQKRVLV